MSYQATEMEHPQEKNMSHVYWHATKDTDSVMNSAYATDHLKTHYAAEFKVAEQFGCCSHEVLSMFAEEDFDPKGTGIAVAFIQFCAEAKVPQFVTEDEQTQTYAHAYVQ